MSVWCDIVELVGSLAHWQKRHVNIGRWSLFCSVVVVMNPVGPSSFVRGTARLPPTTPRAFNLLPPVVTNCYRVTAWLPEQRHKLPVLQWTIYMAYIARHIYFTIFTSAHPYICGEHVCLARFLLAANGNFCDEHCKLSGYFARLCIEFDILFISFSTLPQRVKIKTCIAARWSCGYLLIYLFCKKSKGSLFVWMDHDTDYARKLLCSYLEQSAFLSFQLQTLYSNIPCKMFLNLSTTFHTVHAIGCSINFWNRLWRKGITHYYTADCTWNRWVEPVSFILIELNIFYRYFKFLDPETRLQLGDLKRSTKNLTCCISYRKNKITK